MKKRLLILLLLFALLLSACARKEVPTGGSAAAEPNDAQASAEALAEYMRAAAERSDAIKHTLEHEVLTQTDMNAASMELYELWDGVLNRLWAQLETALPEDEFAALADEQLVWSAAKDAAVKEAGREVEGGSLYALVVNSEASALTEARVYELYELLQSAE